MRQSSMTARMLPSQRQRLFSGVTYQWRKDGVAIEGATDATYTVKNVADSGSYTVKITDTEKKTAVSSATAISITKKEVAVPT